MCRKSVIMQMLHSPKFSFSSG